MKTKDESLFFCNVEKDERINSLVEKFKKYSVDNSKLVYIVQKALGTENDYSYDISDIAIVLMPKHPITIVKYGVEDSDALEDFLFDLKEDLGHVSDKYGYNKVLGRVRKWNDNFFKTIHISDFDFNSFISQEFNGNNTRKIDLLISLLIGSINNIDLIGIEEPQTLLDKVKKKIILYDGQQSRFIYTPPSKKRITIQGLAGTGKTELLLNKLKEVYIASDDSVIAFTCFNRVLASELKNKKIPQFFNFMKVSEQIEWDTRLHVFSSWGLRNRPETGLISFLSDKYKTTFSSFGEVYNFETLCKTVRDELEEKDDFIPCFDYLFIDESQDFGNEFMSLCEKITRKNIYVAGDIFQNIFDSMDNQKDITVDFLLNKCYRTDPRTLMFAHSVGMGLYESPKINWLEDEDWNRCGYICDRDKNNNHLIRLTRKPLRRFEDLNVENTINLFVAETEDTISTVLNCIDSIRTENESVTAEDIAIILLESNYNKMCEYSILLSQKIEDRYEWKTTKGYITKRTEKDSVYISNINHIKGLEFPFVICVSTTSISRNIHSRNKIYTALTRSFLTSFFIVNTVNQEFYGIYTNALKQIKDGFIEVQEPSDKEKIEITTNIKRAKESEQLPLSEIIDIVVLEYKDKNIDREFVENNAKMLSKKHKSTNIIIERLRNICEQI